MTETSEDCIVLLTGCDETTAVRMNFASQALEVLRGLAAETAAEGGGCKPVMSIHKTSCNFCEHSTYDYESNQRGCTFHNPLEVCGHFEMSDCLHGGYWKDED